MIRINEPLKSGVCDECEHCVKEKRTRKCNDAVTKQGKLIHCREIRECNGFKSTYKIEE